MNLNIDHFFLRQAKILFQKLKLTFISHLIVDCPTFKKVDFFVCLLPDYVNILTIPLLLFIEKVGNGRPASLRM